MLEILCEVLPIRTLCAKLIQTQVHFKNNIFVLNCISQLYSA